MSTVISMPSTLPVLHHFDDSNVELFFGRKRQVDDLLSIIQEGRFIGIVGPEGAGKTSLIKAGLIPVLENGFTGAAGREWSFCYCRPGITPIENLASALSEKHVLGDQEKGSLEMDDEIVKLIRKDHSGILNAVSKYSISRDGNLLIIIDQFEDIFDLAEKHKVGLAWEQEVALFFNNIAKAITAKNASIYVLISMQADFIPLLYNFRVLHEHISKGLYSVPNFRQDDFQQIIKGSLLHTGYKIQSDALNYIEEKFNQNLRNLPMVQLLLKKIQLAYPHQDSDEITEINLSNVKKFGELEAIVEGDLNQYFNQLSIFDQQVIEQLFRNITQPGEGLSMKKPKTLKEILDVIGIEKSELIRVITDLKNTQPGILDIIEPYQKNVTHFKEPYISDAAVINLSNNYLIRNWPNLVRWIIEEKESIDTYVRLSESAKLFQLEQTGYLRPPDLELLMAWFDKVQPKKIWADQFNSQYRMSIDYLLKSNETYLEELEQKEEERRLVLKKARKRQLGLMIVVGIVSLFCAFAFFQKYKANQATEAAKISAENAEISKKSAINAATEAAKQKEKALANAKEAKANQVKADAAAIEAGRSKIKAEDATKLAVLKAEEAKSNLESAIKSKKLAESETVKAQKASEEARVARESESELKEFEVAQKKILALSNRLNYEQFDGDVAKLEFTKEVASAYQKLDSLSRKINNGKVIPDNSLFRLLTEMEYKIVENKPKIIESNNYVVDKSSKGGLRSIDAYRNTKIIAAGDDHVLLNYSLSGGVQKIITKKNIKRIRSVKFLDENRVVFTNITGEIYLLNLSNSEEQLVKDFNSDQPINDLIISNDKIFTSFNGNMVQIGLKNFESTILPLKAVEQIFELNEQKIIVKTAQGAFLVDTKSLEALPIVMASLNGQLPNISSVIVSSNKVFMGTEDGKIWVYENPKGTFLNLKNPWYMSSHRSRVTALEYDVNTNQLFTASLDKTSKIYDFTLEDRTKIQAQVVKLEGFEKWIWDFLLIPSQKEDPQLFTVDEKGMLMKWNTQASDIYKKIDNWMKQKSGKK